jgi:type III pantothenate kinase
LDVGNTSIGLGLFRGKRLTAHGRMPTHQSPKSHAMHLAQFLRESKGQGGELETILSSVVPRVTKSITRTIRSITGKDSLVVGESIEAPVKNRYRIPAQVGTDRLVNAAAAFFLYGAPAIVVDFGTAVTVDLVNERQEYLGGVIVPGLEVAWNALIERAALLPQIPLKPPRALLGRDTASSMRAGMFFGYGALCDGLVVRMKQSYAPYAKVIATGGYARLMAAFSKTIQSVDPFLTLRGLELTHRLSLQHFCKKKT